MKARQRRYGRSLASAVLTSAALPTTALGQEGAFRGIESVEERLLQRQDEQRLGAEELLSRPPSGTVLTPKDEAGGDERGRCIPITAVEIVGAELISASRFDRQANALIGPCTPLTDINDLLRVVTNAYVARGLVTSRAVVRQDGLSEGALVIAVFEGALEDIRTEGAGLTSREASLAFPARPGSVLDLRDVEQAVDQLGRLPSREVTVDIEPGEAPGSSVLALKNASRGRPIRASLSTDNLGQTPTGEWTKAMTVEIDRPFKLNDYWSLTASFNEADDGLGDASALSAYVAVPFGKWSLTATGGAFSYSTTVQGNVTQFENAGETWNASLRADRLLYRDQSQKWSINTGLALTDTQNEIEGVRLLTSSYRLVTASLGSAYQKRVLGGAFSASMEYRRGVDALGAESVDAGVTGPQRVFDKVAGRASFVRAVDVMGALPRLSVLATGQWSPDELLPAERFSIGSFGTVRGFQDGGLSGDLGYLIRSQTELDLVRDLSLGGQPVRVGAVGAVDYGAIIRDEDAFFERGHLSSASVGLSVSSPRASAAVTVSQALDAPSFLRLPETQLAFSFGLKF